MPEVPEDIQQIPSILEQMLADFLALLPSLVAAMVILLIGIYIASLVRRAIRATMLRRSANSQAVLLVSKLFYWGVFIIFLIASLQQVGFNLTAFLTGLGIIGFTIGFALQDVSKNFVSGLLLLLQQPFQVGEAVQVSDFTGIVIAIDLRSTALRTFDGRLVLIPNADILTNPITNLSRASSRRAELSLRLPYESDLEEVRRVLLRAIEAVPGLIHEPAPLLQFTNFGPSAIELIIYYWIDTTQTDLGRAVDAALVVVKRALEDMQISIPYPVQTLRLNQPIGGDSWSNSSG